MKGLADSFSAIDLVEEHTVKDVKVTYRPRGPNASWGLMKARGPAIPTLRAVDEAITSQFPTIYRGTRHTDPAKEADVAKLAAYYAEAKIHLQHTGRKISGDADKVKEFVSNGFSTAGAKILPQWIKRRNNFEHGSEQTWPPSEPAPRC